MKIEMTAFGQIQRGCVELADMTLLVGPQASGKSIFLQLIKLFYDAPFICEQLKYYGINWQEDKSQFLSAYFGEGMNTLINDRTKIQFDGSYFNIEDKINIGIKKSKENLLYIPAQRAMVMQTGWPRPFGDYGMDTPFVTKQFSDFIRRLLNIGIGKSEDDVIFSRERRRFDASIFDHLNNSLFKSAKVVLDKGLQRRIMLQLEDNSRLPFMTWSTGQREFLPLLLGFYGLFQSNRQKNEFIDITIIEEPEMGLHPNAISAVILTMLELLHRGYKLIVSTHSPHVLDVMWAIKEIKRNQANPGLLAELFRIPAFTGDNSVINDKIFNVYYFSPEDTGTKIIDISNLDFNHIPSWGGLTEFSSQAAKIVAKAARQGLAKGISKNDL